jgi:hypothetical protein
MSTMDHNFKTQQVDTSRRAVCALSVRLSRIMRNSNFPREQTRNR